MPDRFVPLRQWFLDGRLPIEPIVEMQAEPKVSGDREPPEPVIANDPEDDVCARVRRFRAMLDDALDRALSMLLREIAIDIVGRELQLAPTDIGRIVEAARERHWFDEPPLVVRVHPRDLARCKLDVTVVADPLMRPGDAEIQVRSGSIDASLGVRLERLFERILS